MVVVNRRLAAVLARALAASASAWVALIPVAAPGEERHAPATPVVMAMLDDAAYGRVALDDVVRPESASGSRPDLGLLRQAIEAYRKADVSEGDRLRTGVEDPAARTLLEWIAIRTNAGLGFERVVRFMQDDPSWPMGGLIRRRAEEALLFQRKPPAVVRAFFATQRPISAAGKFALALAFRADGLEQDAAALVRDSWRKDLFGRDFEAKILEKFPAVLTQADHRFRMERFLFKENWDGARRAAGHAGKDYAALVKARQAASDKGKKAVAAFDAVPAALRSDTSYAFSRAQFLRRADKHAEAAKAMAEVTRDPAILADGDEWWTERRIIARKLLDAGNASAAYEIVRNHGAEGAAQRIEAEFHAGWIALRFLAEPAAAAAHFREAARIAETPISVARAAYWQGRTAEEVGADDVARRHYERAAAYPISYYGQLARGRLGAALELRAVAAAPGPERSAAAPQHSAAKALRLLYGVGASNLILPLYADLAQTVKDPAQLQALGDLAAEHGDARGLLMLGKTAVQRGFPLDTHAYPTIGIPAFEPVGGRVDKAMVYAIARQESAFDPAAQSHAGARGLMQLMPATAKRTAQRFGLGFDVNKLTGDPAYNAKLGSAHLGELMQDWKNSLVLTFASYNAGGGNVKKWIDAYGDPRQPHIDAVDWIERIPFSETRNYVQRVFENLRVYRHRLGERNVVLSEAELRHAALMR